MPSAAGKRAGRVLAGCSKPEAGDKPGYYTWQVILGTGSLHRSAQIPASARVSNDEQYEVTTCHESDAIYMILGGGWSSPGGSFLCA